MEVQEALASESNQLQRERGRQERIAATITDQMYLEAQVRTRLVCQGHKYTSSIDLP